MDKKIKIINIYLLAFLLFYCGIFTLLRNIPKLNFFAIVMVMIALLVSCVPDMLINLELIHMNICRYQRELITKEIVFLLTYFYLKDFTCPVFFFLIIAFSIINVSISFLIWKEIKNISFYVFELKDKFQKVNTEKTEEILPYLISYTIISSFLVNFQGTMYESMICVIVSLLANCYIVEKIVYALKHNDVKFVKKYRLFFWMIHILSTICAMGHYDMICYCLVGDYWMIATDLLNKNKTAIVKEKIRNIKNK